jgi:endoglucanase
MSALGELLSRFSQTHGTSGYEEDVRNLFVREVKKLVDELEITPLGSVIAIKRATGSRSARRAGTRTQAPRVLVEAHLDEIGLIVTDIEDGFLRFDEVGSFDARVLPAQNVLVHGKRTIPGIIGARPPHVLSAEERKKTIPIRELFVDVGMSDASVRQLVAVGDTITLDRKVSHLQNDLLSGKAFDDRAGVIALVEMLRRLQAVNHAWDVYIVANVNEEESSLYLGALTSTFQVAPQIAICFDVTHARQPGADRDELPRLGQGPCIARGPNIHPFVFERLRRTAERNALPHQVTVYAGNTETNTWMMQVSGEGVPTGLVELPLRYMHTPVETVSLDDIGRAADLTAGFVESLTLEDVHSIQGETFRREPGTVERARAQVRVKRGSAARVKPAAKGKRARATRPRSTSGKARTTRRQVRTSARTRPARSGLRKG